MAVLLLFALGAYATLVGAQPKTTHVLREQEKLRVTVSKVTSLADVVREICHATASECEGVAKLQSLLVAPLEISGSWNEVLSRLMEGSGLNYVTEAPHAHKGGRLLVRGAVLAATPQPVAVPVQPLAPVVQSPAIAVGAETPPLAESTDFETATESPTAGSAALTMPSNLSLSQMSAGGGGGYLPFLDSRGNPIQTTNDTVQYLPFPDSSGNPIPVKNEPTQYLPFPDSSGNPIPVKNEPAQVLPFPDSKGNPIPATPAPR